ncbi:type II/IV secretion system protein [Candidatus Kuenenbacteria bacterium]|nr:type II/IV secretion system protein [Candidatus Kuenenbacteria bacterium]
MSTQNFEGKEMITNLIDSYLVRAVEAGASDIHIEPEKDFVRFRFRIDGLLKEIAKEPLHLLPALIARTKILAQLNITETRTPQDGRFQIRIKDQNLDLRVSIFPTLYGECAVLRILNINSILVDLESLGMNLTQFKEFEAIIKKPNGLILVIGPTGSGKTTTLYSILNNLNTVEKSILTLEDPIEYHLPLIRQTQITRDLTFIKGLHCLLRQDPDIIMVGEIRDLETAEIVIHAAMTGHLVLSTLHTNDAASALVRLADMKVEPFLISSSVLAIIAQRLIRKICPNCVEEYKPSKEIIETLELENQKGIIFKKGRKCSACNFTGYKGRTGIFEILIVDDEIRSLILSRASVGEIQKKTKEKGAFSLRQHGIEKIIEGVTTPEEILRVTRK